jgi:hypothetical protein
MLPYEGHKLLQKFEERYFLMLAFFWIFSCLDPWLYASLINKNLSLHLFRSFYIASSSLKLSKILELI